MNDDRTLERAARSWLEAGPTQAPDRAVDAALLQIQTTSQERDLRVPWRLPIMFNNRLAMAAAAVVVVVAAGALTFTRLSSVGPGAPSPSPTLIHTNQPTTSPNVPATPGPTSPPIGAALVRLDGTLVQALDLPRGAWAARLSPDGRSVVYADAMHLWVRAIEPGSTPRDLGSLTGAVGGQFGDFPVDVAPAWSPDGTRIAFVSAGDVYLIAVDGRTAPLRLTTDPKLDEWPAWSLDGKVIFYVNAGKTSLDGNAMSATQELWRVDASGGTAKRITNANGPDLQPDVSASSTLAIWSDGTVVQVDPATGDMSGITRVDGSPLRLPDGWNPRWSPDGTKIALLVFDPSGRTQFHPAAGLPSGLNGIALMKVVVVDRVTGTATTVGPRVAAFWNPVSWTPDGQALLINRYDTGP